MSHSKPRKYSARLIPHKLVSVLLWEQADWLMRAWHPLRDGGMCSVRFRARDLSGRTEVSAAKVYESMQFLYDCGVLTDYRREGTHCMAVFRAPTTQASFTPKAD